MKIEGFIQKLSILILAACLLGACSNDDKASQEEIDKMDKVEEIEKILKVTTDEEYVETLKSEKFILDAQYSIMEGMGIATLHLTVDETVTVEQAKQLAHEQEKTVLAEYPDFLPVVMIIQKDVEIYSTLNEEESTEAGK